MSGIIDIILNKDLSFFSCEEKCNLKGKKPTLHLLFKFKDVRSFHMYWYSKFNWFAESVEKNKLYCYYVSC